MATVTYIVDFHNIIYKYDVPITQHWHKVQIGIILGLNWFGQCVV